METCPGVALAVSGSVRRYAHLRPPACTELLRGVTGAVSGSVRRYAHFRPTACSELLRVRARLTLSRGGGAKDTGTCMKHETPQYWATAYVRELLEGRAVDLPLMATHCPLTQPLQPSPLWARCPSP